MVRNFTFFNRKEIVKTLETNMIETAETNYYTYGICLGIRTTRTSRTDVRICFQTYDQENFLSKCI